MEEKKCPILPADDVVQNWFEENIDKECSASSAIYKFRLWLESLQRKAITGAVWVKASAEDRTRWGMHAARYINDNDGLKYTGAAFVEHHSITFYSHLLGELKFGKHQLDFVNLFILDESGTAAGREEDVEKSQFDNWHRWISEQGYTYDGEFYYDEDLNYYTPDQLWGMFK